ncbi:MAG: hypothetical protein V5A88_07685 [Candidatus Thermoplasmatota archaeon]
MNGEGQQQQQGQYQGQPASQRNQQQPAQQQPQSRRQTRGDIKHTLGMILILGVIILLTGAMLISVSGFIDPNPDDAGDRDDAFDNIRYLRAIGSLLITIGVFIPAIGSSYLLYSRYNLSDQEKLILCMIVSASIITFGLVINTSPFGMFY